MSDEILEIMTPAGRFPIHDCTIVKGDKLLVRLRQNGMMTVGAFLDGFEVFSTDEVPDLGPAEGYDR